MDKLNTVKRVSRILVQINENQDQLEQLQDLDRRWNANRQKLEHGFIKIPFVKRRLFDDLGIIKHNIPTLLERDRQFVASYNKLLRQTQAFSKFIDNEIDQLAADNELTVTGNCFDKLSQIIRALNIGEHPYIPD